MRSAANGRACFLSIPYGIVTHMSTLEEKLAQPKEMNPGRARARLSHLLKRWGCRPGEVNPIKVELIFVDVMGEKTEWWKRLEGLATEKDPWFEHIETKEKTK